MSKSIYEMFATDQNLEKNGVWLHFGPDGVYGKFHIARAGGNNKRYLKALEAKTRPIARQIQTNTLEADDGEALMLELYVDTVILGWEDVIGKDGLPLPYSKDNCRQLMKDVPDLFAEIRTYATNFTNFRAQAIEEDAGN